VEPVFGSLLQHYGLRRVNTRGRSSAHKTMLLTAIPFNLKKLLKHQPKKTLRLAIALPKPLLAQQFLRCWRRRYRRQNRLSSGKQGQCMSSATATAPYGPACLVQAQPRFQLPKALGAYFLSHPPHDLLPEPHCCCRTSRIYFWLMEYLIGGVFLALFAWAAARSLYLRYWGVVTRGTIVALALEIDSEGGDTYKPVVAFTTRNNLRVEAKSLYGTREAGTYFRVGEQVTIRYAAQKPTCFAIEGYEGAVMLWFLLFAVVGGVLLWWKIAN
jgi:hypothetical protein